MTRSRDPFATLPVHVVRPLAPLDREALRGWAVSAGQHYVEVDLQDMRDRKAVLRAIGRALAFPAWYGANLDALYDCLTDLEPAQGAAGPGLVLLVDGLPDGPGFDAGQREALLDVLRDAADRFAERGIAFRAFHSVRRGAR